MPAEWHGEKCLQAQIKDKATFHSPTEATATLAPTSKTPDEQEFVVDSRASMRMLSKKDLSSEELETLRKSRVTTTVVTVNAKCK